MDQTVPAGAARLLDFIRETEVGTAEPHGYNVIYGFNQDELSQSITTMTVAEIQAAQPSWTRRFNSSAAGGYQIMRATLTDLKRELGLLPTQIFDADLQDRLAFHLLKRRGYEEYVAGKIDRTEFGKRLAMEWASFPVLKACRGAHRLLDRGQSYYEGDALNRALVSPVEIEACLDEVLAIARAGDRIPTPTSPPRPSPPATPAPSPFSQGGSRVALFAALIAIAIIAAVVIIGG